MKHVSVGNVTSMYDLPRTVGSSESENAVLFSFSIFKHSSPEIGLLGNGKANLARCR